MTGSFQTMRDPRDVASVELVATTSGSDARLGLGMPRERRDHHCRHRSGCLTWARDLRRSTALLTDHYELTMLEAALRSGAADRRCVFEVFARRLPDGRRYGVVAGIGRVLEALAGFRFGDDGARATCATPTWSTRRPATGWPATASPATSAGMPRARSTSPARRCSSSSRRSPRAWSSRRWCCRSSTTTPRSPRPPPG